MNNKRNLFITRLKEIEDEETEILKLQKQYKAGKIKEEDLTQEQIKKLCILYDKQIESLRKTNERRKEKILKYRNATTRSEQQKLIDYFFNM